RRPPRLPLFPYTTLFRSPTKQAVLDMKSTLDEAGIANQDPALRSAARQAFYNTSKFTLRDLKNRANQAQLKADFEAYLDGFSPKDRKSTRLNSSHVKISY